MTKHPQRFDARWGHHIDYMEHRFHVVFLFVQFETSFSKYLLFWKINHSREENRDRSIRGMWRYTDYMQLRRRPFDNLPICINFRRSGCGISALPSGNKRSHLSFAETYIRNLHPFGWTAYTDHNPARGFPAFASNPFLSILVRNTVSIRHRAVCH